MTRRRLRKDDVPWYRQGLDPERVLWKAKPLREEQLPRERRVRGRSRPGPTPFWAEALLAFIRALLSNSRR